MDRRRLLSGGVALAAALPAAQMAFAQEAAAPATVEIEEAKLPALEGGTFLMMASQLAAERGSSDAVRVFAELETAEQMAVMRACGAEGVQVPLREDHQAILDQLGTLEGAEFDAAYLDAQIAGHEEARPIHEEYAANGQDPMARGASMVGVTGIDSHLVMLRSFRDQVSAG